MKIITKLSFLLIFCCMNIYGKNISTGTININTATFYQLTLLPGVGKATAKKIIASRSQQKIVNKADLKERKLIRRDYLQKAQKLIIFQGDHQYHDPNKQHHNSTKRSYKTPSKNNIKYTINKAINIKDAERITLLTDGSLFHHLSKGIESAQTEIWLSTFIFKSSANKRNRATKIIQLLKKKAKQGVQVKLLLEQSQYHQELSDENHRLAKRLRRHNIQVFFDSMHNTMHNKTIVIDKKYVYIGSHNMTDSALRHNHETSLMITSAHLAKELISYFKLIAQEK